MSRRLLVLCFTIVSLYGRGQYKYLGTYTADGTPQYFVQRDIIPQSTLDKIKQALPENYPVPKYNPQYISSGYETDIRLIDSASIYITFVGEGAGYKSSLGFYTYKLNAPRTQAPTPEEITIMFPNISASGSGGSLVPGDKILLGHFPANTGIGFVLIADGWRGGAVTNGNWMLYSNPAFNPEANANLKQHNVVLYDSALQKMILSFEDIRRDYGSCDNDFNDATFYISANPFTSIEQGNYTPIEIANSEISSGNTGGLESNGKLASKIAVRSFKRDSKAIETNTERSQQQRFVPQPIAIATNNGQGTITKTISSYFPLTGMTGSEVSYISTPKDLINITNANDVFTLDYYLNNKRVAVGFVSHTSETVYDHSKVICDRLNGSVIKDIRTILLNQHKLINTTLLRANGETEYALHFSVKKQNNNYRLYSFWNIDAYPKGEYLNFQFWGSSMSEICSIAFEVLKSLDSESPVISNESEIQIPDVFMKSGEYKNGKLLITIANKSKAGSLIIKGNITKAENFTTQPITKNIPLSGRSEEKLEIETGFLFDAGIALSTHNQLVEDHFYLADGAWGIDYKSQDANAINFSVQPCNAASAGNVLKIERDPIVKGDIKGVVNLFRNARAGNQPLAISDYNSISFELQSNKAVEIVIVPDSLSDWDNRPRYNIAATTGTEKITIPLSKFKDKSGLPVKWQNIRTIVFSLKGNDASFEPFTLKISNTMFVNHQVTNPSPSSEQAGIFIYPNPMVEQAIVRVPKNITSASLLLIDMNGRKVMNKDVVFTNGEYKLKVNNLISGLYKLVVISSSQQILNTTISVIK